MTTVLVFLGVLGFLVIAHELGHYTVAKLTKVKVLEFGIGYPPRLFGFKRGDTTYSVNLLPLGGFVRMLGEEDPTHEQSFAKQSARTRLAVLAAGPLMNAVLPILLLTAVFMLPQQVPSTDVVVLSVAPGSPAAQAGVQPGDVIRAADGHPINNSNDLVGAVQQRLGADMTWVIDRSGQQMTVRIPEVRLDPPAGQGATGITLTDARVTVTSVTPGSPAALAGLRVGDEFLAVANNRVLSADGAQTAAASALASNAGTPVSMTVLRNGALVNLTLPADAGGLTGYEAVATPDLTQSESFFHAVPSAFGRTWDILVSFKNGIQQMIAGGAGFAVAGPVGIAQMTGEVARAGLSPLIQWTALLSINLAIVNLLPIPALDGGRITFVLLELARGGRRLAPDKERLVHLVGFALLMALILFVSINDVQRLFSGASIIGG